MKLVSALILSILTMVLMIVAHAQVGPMAEDATIGEIFSQVVKIFGQWGGLTYQYKIAAVLFILVAVVKNSMFLPHWEKLGKFRPLVAPLLSLVAFLMMVQPFTLETFLAAITTGAAAAYFSQIVDVLKMFPGIGTAIEFISLFVGKIFKKPSA